MLEGRPVMKEFLNTYLNTHWKAQRLKGDSGERSYSRIRSAKGSFIFVEHPLSNKNFEDFLLTQNVLKKNFIPIPQILHIDKKNKLLLLEDLGPTDLEQFYLKNKKLDYHVQALDLLYSFQRISDSKNFKKKFTNSQSLNELLLTYQSLNYPLKNPDKECLLKEFHALSCQLAKQPFVPSHRDFHSRNLLICKGQVYMIDFQDAGLYPQYYDLASFIYDPYVSLLDEERKILIQHYNQKWSKPVCIDSLSLMACQRVFKAIGSFMSFYNLRRQTQHLKYIRPCLVELKQQLSQLEKYPHFLKYVQSLLDSK